MNSQTEPLTLQPLGTVCACVSEHRPASVQFERHHIWPLEYGGPSVPENLVYICGTTHNTIHAYIRAFRRDGRILTRTELRDALPRWNYTPVVQGYAYSLAVLGFERMQRGAL